jgi:hypothetical protein
MNTKNFKNNLQKEIFANEFSNKIEKVTEIGINTVIRFKEQIFENNNTLITWLYNRFNFGISLTRADKNLVIVNTPNKQKEDIEPEFDIKGEVKDSDFSEEELLETTPNNEVIEENLIRAKNQLKKEIMEAYIFLREKNMSIPSDTLEFIKDAALEKIKTL